MELRNEKQRSSKDWLRAWILPDWKLQSTMVTEQPVREDGYPGSTIGSPLKNTHNKLVASGYVLCWAEQNTSCLACTHPTQGCLLMQDAGDFRKTENQDEVVQLSRLPPGRKIAEGLLEVNHFRSATGASVSLCWIYIILSHWPHNTKHKLSCYCEWWQKHNVASLQRQVKAQYSDIHTWLLGGFLRHWKWE